MKKILSAILLLLNCTVGVNAQNVYVKKTGVNPSFLTRHGIYFSIEDTQSDRGIIFHTLQFYNDGTFYVGGHNYDSKSSMLAILDDNNNPNHDKNSLLIQDAWGSYYISRDTIYMQRFSYTPGTEFSEKTTGMVAVIKNDSSFSMIKETCDWCGINEYFGSQGHIFDEPVAYDFHRLNRLPDPGLAWFRKKAWFIEGNQEQTFAGNR